MEVKKESPPHITGTKDTRLTFAAESFQGSKITQFRVFTRPNPPKGSEKVSYDWDDLVPGDIFPISAVRIFIISVRLKAGDDLSFTPTETTHFSSDCKLEVNAFNLMIESRDQLATCPISPLRGTVMMPGTTIHVLPKPISPIFDEAINNYTIHYWKTGRQKDSVTYKPGDAFPVREIKCIVMIEVAFETAGTLYFYNYRTEALNGHFEVWFEHDSIVFATRNVAAEKIHFKTTDPQRKVMWRPNETKKEVFWKKNSNIEIGQVDFKGSMCDYLEVRYLERFALKDCFFVIHGTKFISRLEKFTQEFNMFIQSITVKTDDHQIVDYYPTGHVMQNSKIVLRFLDSNIIIMSEPDTVKATFEAQISLNNPVQDPRLEGPDGLYGPFYDLRRLGKDGPLVPQIAVDQSITKDSANGLDERNRAFRYQNLITGFSDLGYTENLEGTPAFKTIIDSDADNFFYSVSYEYGRSIKPIRPSADALEIVDVDTLRQFCDRTTKEIKRDFINLLIYSPTNKSTSLEAAMQHMVQMKNEGKIKYIGLANVSSETIRRAHKIHPISAVRIDAAVILLGMGDGNPSFDVLQTCDELGIAVLVNNFKICCSFADILDSMRHIDSDIYNAIRKAIVSDGYEPDFDMSMKLFPTLETLGKMLYGSPSLMVAYLLAQGHHIIPLIPFETLRRFESKTIVRPIWELSRMMGSFKREYLYELSYTFMELGRLQDPWSKDTTSERFMDI